MTNQKKQNWIDKMYGEFRAIEASNPHIFGGFVIGNRTVVVDIANPHDPQIGVARCSSEDDFNLATGIAIAYARMREYGVPDYVISNEPEPTTFGSIPVGTVFVYDAEFYTKIGAVGAVHLGTGNIVTFSRAFPVIPTNPAD